MAVNIQAQDNKAAVAPKLKMKSSAGRPLPTGLQILCQVLCITVAISVLLPIMWVVSVSLSGLDNIKPAGFIPEKIDFGAYERVFTKPTNNPVDFLTLLKNSFLLAAGTSLFSVAFGVSAAYAFSRFKFKGRQFLMLAILAVLMLPAVATLAPLFTMFNGIQIGDFNLRQSLIGVGIAITSSLLPFAIWNLKGYLDTIPKDLEEAGMVDGATRIQIFFQIILPLATPALAVTALFGFISGWTEFYFSWLFLNNPQDFTLAMALSGMSGQFARTTPWSLFSAFAIVVALPVAVVYLALQKYIVSGLTVGGVKG
jgi:arabinogalactan oligomer/maltooligosaccharide transport system permease protein